MGEAYEPFTPITEAGQPTAAQMDAVAKLHFVTGRYIEAQTGHRVAAILIPAAWGWKMSADQPDPDGIPYATVMGVRCVPADIPEPMVAFA